jgi:hypothetical protein
VTFDAKLEGSKEVSCVISMERDPGRGGSYANTTR